MSSVIHPVLHYLAVARAARDFGLDPDTLDALASHIVPGPESIDEFADAAAAALLEPRD